MWLMYEDQVRSHLSIVCWWSEPPILNDKSPLSILIEIFLLIAKTKWLWFISGSPSRQEEILAVPLSPDAGEEGSERFIDTGNAFCQPNIFILNVCKFQTWLDNYWIKCLGDILSFIDSVGRLWNFEFRFRIFHTVKPSGFVIVLPLKYAKFLNSAWSAFYCPVRMKCNSHFMFTASNMVAHDLKSCSSCCLYEINNKNSHENGYIKVNFDNRTFRFSEYETVKVSIVT